MPRHELGERIYHHFGDLEEYHSGMWRIVRGDERKGYIEASANLMRNPQWFKTAMQEVIETWVNSCQHNLTAEAVNRIAWLGHAGCCVGVQSPEDCTRAGWHTLTRQEQDEANRAAAEVLAEWDNANSSPMMFQLWSDNA